jgi:tetratricopeptide (TPR) repeat protein
MMQTSVHNSRGDRLKSLNKALELQYRQGRFSLLIAGFDYYTFRDKLIAEINKYYKNSVVFEITENKFPGFSEFENHLVKLSQRFSVIHLINHRQQLYRDTWPEFFKGLNYHRERIADENRVSIILWLLKEDIREFALTAADMWAWRSGVFFFGRSNQPDQLLVTTTREKDIPSRIDEILKYLKDHANLETDEKAFFYQELGDLYYRLAYYEEAEKYVLKNLEIQEKKADPVKMYLQYKMLVSIYKAVGEDEKALSITRKINALRTGLSPSELQSINMME